MTETELFEKIYQLQRIVDNLEQENRVLRTKIAIVEDERDALKHRARIGEATENFLTEIKRIMR